MILGKLCPLMNYFWKSFWLLIFIFNNLIVLWSIFLPTAFNILLVFSIFFFCLQYYHKICFYNLSMSWPVQQILWSAPIIFKNACHIFLGMTFSYSAPKLAWSVRRNPSELTNKKPKWACNTRFQSNKRLRVHSEKEVFSVISILQIKIKML